ncbi:MAG: hypothetical protein DMF66_10405 [Acidobacteria bacterium]|nr:MAG: hypothetical protein DMF66_10405 [Acidobacteriota bacterium]
MPSSTKADASTRSAAETPGAATPKEGRAAETSSEAFSPQPAALLAPAAGDVTATMSAAVTVDADSDGKADPGDTITYTTTLDNTTGTSDATGLTFSDTIDSHTTLVNGTLNSTPVAFDRTGAKSVTTDEDTPVNITLSGQDPDADALTFSIVTPPNAAKGALGTLGAPDCATTPGICTATVTYTPNANVNGTDGFTFSVKDSKNANSNQLGTVSITVNAVNDAPTITAPANYSINEDTPKTISDISVADVDAGSGSEQVTLTVQHGAIKINTTGGLTISGNNSASVTMTGTITNLNAGLNGMTYTPAQDFNNTRGSESLGITINDQGNTGTGPVGGISVNKSVPINIAAVNDAPVAKPKSLTAESNMKIRYQINLAADGSGDVTDADKGDGSFTDSFTLASVTPLSCAGCSISIFDASAGTFDFDPPAGFTGGNVTLQYTVTDNGNPLPTQTSAAATITVAVSGPIIWFVNLGAGSNGDGRLSNPFNSLASANTAMSNNGSTNQRIFVYSTTANTTAASGAGVTLQAGQWLIGQGATDTNNTTSFDTFMGITPPSNTIARPSLTGTRPTIQGRVQMNGSNTRVQSFDIKPPAGTQGLTGTNGSAPGAGTAMTGMQVGVSAAKSDVTVTTTGQSGTNAMAVSLTNAGGTFSFISISANQDLSSNKPAKGVSLSSVTGSFNVLGTGTTAGSGGTIQNVSGNGFEIIGASSAPSLTLKNLNLTNTAQTNGNSPGNCLNGTLVASGTASCTAGLFMSGVTSVTLDNVNINGTKQYGINGIGVSGLTMQNGTQVQSAGDEQGEGGVFFQNLTGTATISNFTAKNNIGAQFEVDNLASGSLTFNVTGSSFNGLGKANVNSNQGLYLHPDASGANITATVNSTTFFNNHSYGLQGNADNSGHLTMNVGLTAACKFGDISGGAVANANSNGMFLATSSGQLFQRRRHYQLLYSAELIGQRQQPSPGHVRQQHHRHGWRRQFGIEPQQ